jgi:uncharacterized protein YqeY
MDNVLLTRINADKQSAKLNGETIKLDILNYLRGEIDRFQITEDVKIVAIIKKLVDNLRETPTETSEEEIAVLVEYLPASLTEEQIDTILDGLMNGEEGVRSIGQLMKHFKDTYPNQYDGKLLSQKVKAKING